MSTLADRIKERLQATGLSNAQLAAAAKVKQPTAHNWGSGKTKAIKGEPLLAAAAALGVNPKWLATGFGPKFPDAPMEGARRHDARERSAKYGEESDPWIREALMLLTSMSPEDRRAAVLNLRVFSKSLGPPGNGQDLSVAA